MWNAAPWKLNGLPWALKIDVGLYMCKYEQLLKKAVFESFNDQYVIGHWKHPVTKGTQCLT